MKKEGICEISVSETAKSCEVNALGFKKLFYPNCKIAVPMYLKYFRSVGKNNQTVKIVFFYMKLDFHDAIKTFLLITGNFITGTRVSCPYGSKV